MNGNLSASPDSAARGKVLHCVMEKSGLEDLEILMEWRMRVLEEVFDLDPSSSQYPILYQTLFENNKSYYQKHLADDSHTALFARCGNHIVGCGGICYTEEMPSPDNPSGRCGYLMNIYTLPALRHHQIGRQIVEALIQDAKKRRTGKIYLESSQDGLSLYQSLGFQPLLDLYKLPQTQNIPARSGGIDEEVIHV